MTIKTRKLVFLSLFAAMLCIVSPFSLPIGVIPISLATFAMYIAASVLGASGTISVLVYIFIGAVGVPVFSGGLGGIDRLVGPTGGYIVGFIPCTLIAGLIIDRFENRKIAYPIAMIAGTAVLGNNMVYYPHGQIRNSVHARCGSYDMRCAVSHW